MDGHSVRTSLAPHERKLPYYEDLLPMYHGLGAIVLESSTTYDFAEDRIAEDIFSDKLFMVPGNDTFESVKTALESDNPTYEDAALEAGLTLADSIAENSKNQRGVILGYLNAAFEIDKLKIGLTGQSASVTNEHAIISVLRAAVADNLPCDDRTLNSLRHIGVVLDDLIEKQPFFGWFRPKLDSLITSVSEIYNSRILAEKLAPTNKDSIELYGGSSQIREDIDDFMAMTIKERKYGVKSAYTAASVGGSWVYYDGPNYKAQLSEHLTRNTDALKGDYVAVIFHTPKTELTNLRVEVEEVNYSPTAQSTLAGGALLEMGTDLILYLNKNGDINLDAQGLVPLKTVFKQSPGAYESLQAELISNFHDLVMPAEVVNGRHDPKYEPGDNNDKYDPILDLLLPRMRKVNPAKELPAEAFPTRTVRLHDVDWFVRELPNGWKASPDAIAAARAHNVELKPNQTFVSSHKRGKDNEVKGHRIQRK